MISALLARYPHDVLVRASGQVPLLSLRLPPLDAECLALSVVTDAGGVRRAYWNDTVGEKQRDRTIAAVRQGLAAIGRPPYAALAACAEEESDKPIVDGLVLLLGG
jgi:hypothetical protein